MPCRIIRRLPKPTPKRTSVAEALAGIADPHLRGVLGARWGDYGPPPAQAPRVEHALVTGAYDGGAWYPVGGPARFAQTLGEVIRAVGGELRLGADVQRVRVHDGRVAGVTLIQGGQRTEESAPTVISAIGVANTVACLDECVAATWRETVQALVPGVGFLSLSIGLEGDIASAGASAANHWIYPSEELGRLWGDPAEEDSPNLFVSFGSLKDPAHAGPPTAEVLAVVDPAVFTRWLRQQEPGDDYPAWKDWVADRMLDQFGSAFPGLRA